MFFEEFARRGEYLAAGMYENEDRGLFYRKAIGLRRYYENCPLPEYTGTLLYPSGPIPCDTKVFPTYIDGYRIAFDRIPKEDEALYRQITTDFGKYRPTVPSAHTVGGNMWNHSIPNYPRVLKEGLISYKERASKIADKDIREGLIELVCGIECYVKRCADHLTEKGAPTELIERVKKVPLYPAESFIEAVSSWNMVMYLDRCDNLGPLAEGLLPYYNGEDAVALLENLFDNLDKNGGYSMSIHDSRGPLVLPIFEAAKGKRRPMIEFFVDENTPDEVWESAFRLVKTNGGQPAFYNPKALLGGICKKFPEAEKDINQFCGGGCAESMIAGLSNVGSLDAGINLALILTDTIKQRLTKSADFDDFCEGYLEDVKAVCETVMNEISNSQREREKYNPLPMRTLLTDDCIDKGMDYNSKGARYRWSVVNFAGTINVIDSLLVIRDFIFKDKKYSKEQVIALLERSDEDFLKECRNHTAAFGRDDADTNRFTKEITSRIFGYLSDGVPYLGGGYIPASIQFNAQVAAGRNVGATPDGRTSGAPLCDSLGAIFGKDTLGPTALLNSVTSISLNKLIGTPILNFNITNNFNPKVLKALILGFMNGGGMQMQITCASKEMLLEAYENPEMHKNLVVRVGGYSEYFHYLPKDIQRFIIDRTVH